jgi:hypothetical protein
MARGAFNSSKVPASNQATAVTMADGTALIVGRYTVVPTNQSRNPIASAAVWHVTLDGAIHRAAPMASARVSPYAVRLSDGTVLVMGPDAGGFVPGKARGPVAGTLRSRGRTHGTGSLIPATGPAPPWRPFPMVGPS